MNVKCRNCPAVARRAGGYCERCFLALFEKAVGTVSAADIGALRYTKRVAVLVTPEEFTEYVFSRSVAKGDGCWEWQGNRGDDGYGRLRIAGTKRDIKAHRYSWEKANGPVPDGLFVLHKCDNPPCVRPDHLFLGTLGDNNRDCQRKGRANNQAKGLAGERNNRNKLTESQVLEIRRRAAAGERLSPLSREFGVTVQSVHAIVWRRTWKLV